MNEFGDLNDATGICSVFYIPEKDYINKVLFQHDSVGINFIYISTAGKATKSFGEGAASSQSETFDFKQDGYMFYGLAGSKRQAESNQALNSLAVIQYDNACVKKERFSINSGETLSWGVDSDGFKIEIIDSSETQPERDDGWVMADWIWRLFAGSIAFNVLSIAVLFCCCCCCCRRKSD